MEEMSANKRALYIGSNTWSLTIRAIFSESLITSSTLPLWSMYPQQHPQCYGRYRPEVGYSCLLIEDQTLLDTAVQQFSTQFDVVVVHSHRVHFVTYFWYQDNAQPPSIRGTMATTAHQIAQLHNNQAASSDRAG
jgi:hypothetical protein